MTNAMKRLLQELCGYHNETNIYHRPKAFSLLVTNADIKAAETLQNAGIVRIVGIQHPMAILVTRPRS